MAEEINEHTPEEQLAAKALSEASMERIQGWKGAEVAVAAFGQAQQSQAALMGLIQLLLHKGILSPAELGDSMAWCYRERAHQLLAQKEGNKSPLVLPAAPAARHRQ
jgi:hypothetical protein